MSIYQVGFAVVGAVLLGFVAGLVTYRKSRRWCTVCGSGLRCLTCLRLGHLAWGPEKQS